MSATVTLYELTSQLQILDAQIEERAAEIDANGGALPDDLAALLDDAEEAFDAKVERVALYIKTLGHTAVAVATERDRLAARVKALDTAKAALTEYLKRSLEAAGKKDVKGTLANVAIQNSPPSVTSVLDAPALARLHEAYVDLIDLVPETYKLNAKAVIAAHKAGRALPNGVLVTSGTHLRIR